MVTTTRSRTDVAIWHEVNHPLGSGWHWGDGRIDSVAFATRDDACTDARRTFRRLGYLINVTHRN